MLFQSKERKANKELLDLYKCWYSEISNIAPSLLGDKYSNPWYCAVPDKWFGDSERILIVGEDGFGFDGNGKADGIRPDEIKKLQERSLDFFKHYIANTSDGEHPFWMRARLVAFRGVPVAYTFLNKFSMKRDHRSKPSDSDRVLMHSTSMKLLAEEISILKPTVVYFFGWYGDVIKMELPTVHKNCILAEIVIAVCGRILLRLLKMVEYNTFFLIIHIAHIGRISQMTMNSN